MATNFTTAVTRVTSQSMVFPNLSDVTDLPPGLQMEPLGNALAIVLTVLSGYLVVVLAFYEWRKKWSEKSRVNKLHLVSSIAAFLSCLSEQLELRLGKSSDMWCSLYTLLVALFYTVGSLSTYTLLWWRQRTFYTDPLLRRCNSRTMRCVSGFTIFGVYSALIATVFILTFSYELRSTHYGCIIDLKEGHSFPAVTSLVVLAASYIAFQILLLMLILYPLTRASGISVQICGDLRLHSPGRNIDLLPLVRRLMVCSAVCVISALLFSTVAICCFLYAPNSYWSLIVHADLIVNTLSIVCTTANWRQRLFPCSATVHVTELSQTREIVIDSV